MAVPKFTFIDLFAGIGGIRRGFEYIGGKCVFTSEWDKFARITYAANHNETEADIAGDIWSVPLDVIPDHDVLVGGFPCQPFSLAGVSKKNALGRTHGFACDAQGTLFFRVAEILKEKRPAAFMLENVKNLVSHNKGHTFRVIQHVLEKELGYHISWKVIDGKRWTPQHRERIYIVGFREDVGFEWPDESAWPEPGSIKLGSILEPEEKVDAKYILTDKLWNYLQAYRDKHSKAGNGFGCSVVTRNETTRTLSARYHKDGSEILVHRGPGLNPRRLTPRECARLMGFEDSFVLPVSDTQLYRQFGNSVVVPAVEAVARAMEPYLRLALKMNGKASGVAKTPEKPAAILKGTPNLPSRPVKIPVVA
ncbi:DNA (cytosine-5-)-methyltransferase [Burkholderia diffusa]|uniref:Cytosine-specific methyltransferase n=1 Tax=Burkholderia diffusa TaxID=488732 RepID=A0A6P2MRQ7_9BURK|nr:DNA (cytosine-5-)-methyltransferase [Burkholderia diffusa]KAB0649684.1 DNA (cytosine-5-)-methyltransferase [Burkholderia diffusa]MBM2652899.1 DNA (cytosine-5-)-methyltransferase [Burkholderia diffusa]VWB84496.1 cytosine methyltransferase [Burkholderia diffusa]